MAACALLVAAPGAGAGEPAADWTALPVRAFGSVTMGPITLVSCSFAFKVSDSARQFQATMDCQASATSAAKVDRTVVVTFSVLHAGTHAPWFGLRTAPREVPADGFPVPLTASYQGPYDPASPPDVPDLDGIRVMTEVVHEMRVAPGPLIPLPR